MVNIITGIPWDSHAKLKYLSILCKLKLLFNREYTKGYIKHEKDVINEFRPNHVGVLIGKIKNGKILLSGDVNQGDGIRVIGKKDTGLILNYIYKNNKLVNSAKKADFFGKIRYCTVVRIFWRMNRIG